MHSNDSFYILIYMRFGGQLPAQMWWLNYFELAARSNETDVQCTHYQKCILAFSNKVQSTYIVQFIFYLGWFEDTFFLYSILYRCIEFQNSTIIMELTTKCLIFHFHFRVLQQNSIHNLKYTIYNSSQLSHFLCMHALSPSAFHSLIALSV